MVLEVSFVRRTMLRKTWMEGNVMSVKLMKMDEATQVNFERVLAKDKNNFEARRS